jgi:hypothetical protein
VIEEHNRTFERKGRAAFGKVGARLSSKSVKLLQGQIAEGRPTRLYVIVRGKDGYCAYSAELADMGHVGARQVSSELFPPYYEEAGLAPTTYFILKTALVQAKTDGLLLSRGQNLMETVARCRTTHMLVSERVQEPHGPA